MIDITHVEDNTITGICLPYASILFYNRHLGMLSYFKNSINAI